MLANRISFIVRLGNHCFLNFLCLLYIMIKPEFSTSRFTKLCCFFNKFVHHWSVKYGFGPILIWAPAAVFTILLQSTELIKQLPFSESLIRYQLPLLILFVVFGVIGNVLLQIIRDYSVPNSQISKDDFFTILNSLNVVVSSKNERFLKATKEALKEGWAPERVFEEITKPDQQIALLICSIQGIFETIFEQKVEIRVGLMELENKKPADWFVFAPYASPPRTSSAVLKSPSSTIMCAIKSGGLVVIEDMVAEFKKKSKSERKCVKGSVSDKENGSLIAMPIYCPNTKDPIYVLSIKANKPKAFIEADKERYKWIFENIFFTRILLEHHVMLMKQIGDCE